MDSSQIKTYAVATTLFMGCALAGYFVTGALFPKENLTTEVAATSGGGSSTSTGSMNESVGASIEVTDTNSKKVPTVDPIRCVPPPNVQPVLTVSCPSLSGSGLYSFVASCPGAFSYELWSLSPARKVQGSTNGSFSGVQGSKKGYKVCALDKAGQLLASEMIHGIDPVASTAESPAKPTVSNEQRNAELTSVINGSSNDYPRGIRISYTNLDTENGEEAQTSIANVRSYIKTGIWKSVTVVDAKYDSRGKATAITLHINR